MDSPIRKFYKDKSIFLTGGSGFVGLLTIEKLMRCTEARRIYVLIRPKKGQSCEQRIENMCKDELFTTLRKMKPDFTKKIIGIPGECGLPRLGISENDRLRLCQSVNIVFHSAASINMSVKLSESLSINVGGTQAIIDLCRDMELLQAFVYVSTAYSNSNRGVIDEIVYDPVRTADELYEMDEDAMNEFPAVKEANFPNVYTLTKNLAEHVIKTKAADLPAVIFRPALITPTAEEPVVGFINNFYSAIGVHYLQSIGLWKVVFAPSELPMELVPADKCISLMLASAWDVAHNKPESLPVYNFTSVKENAILGLRYYRLCLAANKKFPSMKAVRHLSDFHVISNPIMFKIYKLYYHLIPAKLMDILLMLTGRKPQLINAYKKIDLVSSTLNPLIFTKLQWNYENSKVLWKRMTPADRTWLNFDLASLNWEQYIFSYTEGMRTYLVKDDPKTLPQAHALQRRLKMIHYGVVGGATIVALALTYFLRHFWFIFVILGYQARTFGYQLMNLIRERFCKSACSRLRR